MLRPSVDAFASATDRRSQSRGPGSFCPRCGDAPLLQRHSLLGVWQLQTRSGGGWRCSIGCYRWVPGGYRGSLALTRCWRLRRCPWTSLLQLILQVEAAEIPLWLSVVARRCLDLCSSGAPLAMRCLLLSWSTGYPPASSYRHVSGCHHGDVISAAEPKVQLPAVKVPLQQHHSTSAAAPLHLGICTTIPWHLHHSSLSLQVRYPPLSLQP